MVDRMLRAGVGNPGFPETTFSCPPVFLRPLSCSQAGCYPARNAQWPYHLTSVLPPDCVKVTPATLQPRVVFGGGCSDPEAPLVSGGEKVVIFHPPPQPCHWWSFHSTVYDLGANLCSQKSFQFPKGQRLNPCMVYPMVCARMMSTKRGPTSWREESGASWRCSNKFDFALG